MNENITDLPDGVCSFQLFQRAGLPQRVIVSPKARERLHLPASPDAPEWLDLMWVVRGVVTGLMPTVEIKSHLGRARVAEFCSFTAESPEPVERRIAVVELEEQTVLVALPEELVRPGGKPRVLLVEDDADIRQLTALILQSAGMEVTEAADGVTGWQAAQASPPALVLTDVDMPRLDGLQLCSRLKQEPLTKMVPVLVWSGNPGHETNALKVGAAAFISKPINPQNLVALIKQYLNPASTKA